MDERNTKIIWKIIYYPNEFDPKSDKTQTFNDNFASISEDDADFCNSIISSVYVLVTDFSQKNIKFCDMHFVKYMGKYQLSIWIDVNNETFNVKFIKYEP